MMEIDSGDFSRAVFRGCDKNVIALRSILNLNIFTLADFI